MNKEGGAEFEKTVPAEIVYCDDIGEQCVLDHARRLSNLSEKSNPRGYLLVRRPRLVERLSCCAGTESWIFRHPNITTVGSTSSSTTSSGGDDQPEVKSILVSMYSFAYVRISPTTQPSHSRILVIGYSGKNGCKYAPRILLCPMGVLISHCCLAMFPCRTPTTESYDIIDVAEGMEWFVWTGKVETDYRVSIECNECDGNEDCNYNGECGREEEGLCSCKAGFFGTFCQFTEPCSVIRCKCTMSIQCRLSLSFTSYGSL